jgi:BirA family biotin operon repressor/biotin-[acetyl-CoA-carboxylase] ligase
VTSTLQSRDTLAESLLSVIRQKPGTLFSFGDLEKKCHTDRAVLIQSAQLLADWGYRITVRASSGITFLSAPDHLTAIEIRHELRTKHIGKTIHAFRTVKSTNDLAASQADSGAPEGTIVVADQQTKGRGRLGRVWFSPPETGIYLSIILRPKFAPDQAPGLSLMTALALADSLDSLCPKTVQIKWPNDLLLGGKKVAGILTELSAERDKISHVVVGVGINVNHGVGHFPDELRTTATSIRRHLKHKVNRVELLRDFLTRFEREYTLYAKNRLASRHKRLCAYSSLLGKSVTVIAASHRVTGVAQDIDVQGRLILNVQDRLVPVTAGEVTVKK